LLLVRSELQKMISAGDDSLGKAELKIDKLPFLGLSCQLPGLVVIKADLRLQNLAEALQAPLADPEEETVSVRASSEGAVEFIYRSTEDGACEA